MAMKMLKDLGGGVQQAEMEPRTPELVKEAAASLRGGTRSGSREKEQPQAVPAYNPGSLLSLNMGPISARTADDLVRSGQASATVRDGQVYVRRTPSADHPDNQAPLYQAKQDAAQQKANNDTLAKIRNYLSNSPFAPQKVGVGMPATATAGALALASNRTVGGTVLGGGMKSAAEFAGAGGTLLNAFNNAVEPIVPAGDVSIQQNQAFAEKLNQTYETLSRESDSLIADAKKGKGKISQTLVDVGVAGIQMGGDALLNFVAPGAGLGSLGTRAFGGASQRARLEGASIGQQLAYGTANAAAEVLTEKMFDGLAGIYGGGMADDVVNRTIGKLTKSTAGQNALKVLASAGGEAAEEVAAGVVEPALRSIYNGRRVAENYGADTLSDIAHDMIVGGVLGGVGGGTQVLTGQFVPMVREENKSVEVNTNSRGTSTVKANTSLFNRTILNNFNVARKFFIDYAQKNFPSSVINQETGKQIGISRIGLDKFLSGNLYYSKYATGFHIPELVENAHKVGEASNYHQKTAESIPTYEYFDSPISVDGKQYMAHIRVKNTNVGDKYYGHTISEVEDIIIESPTRSSVPQNEAVYLEKISDSNEIIPQSTDHVNPPTIPPIAYAALLRALLESKVAPPTLTPEQRAALEAWNNAFPEMRMTEEEFLER